ncbi:MAG TPA: GPP34 family phosphoprotein [Pseudonocardiaceae bacterium]|jgi:hypothetical protein|nr:GPP34 family phosphoprotein [Pseudonocardiaceae bacterium]
MPTRSQPKTLPAKLYLLSVDPDSERLSTSRELGVLLRGAALADLSMRKFLREEGGKVVASGTKRVGDPVLDDLLREISEAPGRNWRTWVRRGTRNTTRALEQQLESGGLITVRELRVLGIFPARKIGITDTEIAAALRENVHDTLYGEQSVEEIDKFDAALVLLVAAGGLRGLVPRKDERTYADRMKALGERAGGAVPGVLRVIQQVKQARAAAYAGGG